MILCISKYSSRIFQQVISITYKLCINNCRSLHIGLKFLFRLSDQALLKALYLSTFEATKKWTMPLRNWGRVYGELQIMYEGRLPE